MICLKIFDLSVQKCHLLRTGSVLEERITDNLSLPKLMNVYKSLREQGNELTLNWLLNY